MFDKVACEALSKVKFIVFGKDVASAKADFFGKLESDFVVKDPVYGKGMLSVVSGEGAEYFLEGAVMPLHIRPDEKREERRSLESSLGRGFLLLPG